MNESDVDEILIWIRDCIDGRKHPKKNEIDRLKTLAFIHGETLLHFSVVEGLYREVSFLLGHGWICEVVNRLGSTPLVDAVKREDEHMVKMLLELGADPNFTDKEKNIPLHHAHFEGNEGIIKLLIEFGSDLSAKNIYGETPEEF